MLGLLILAIIVLAPNLRIFVEQRAQIAELEASVAEHEAAVDELDGRCRALGRPRVHRRGGARAAVLRLSGREQLPRDRRRRDAVRLERGADHRPDPHHRGRLGARRALVRLHGGTHGRAPPTSWSLRRPPRRDDRRAPPRPAHRRGHPHRLAAARPARAQRGRHRGALRVRQPDRGLDEPPPRRRHAVPDLLLPHAPRRDRRGLDPRSRGQDAAARRPAHRRVRRAERDRPPVPRRPRGVPRRPGVDRRGRGDRRHLRRRDARPREVPARARRPRARRRAGVNPIGDLALAEADWSPDVCECTHEASA